MIEKNLTQEMIFKMIQWVESSGDFLKEQAPDYVDQYIRYSIVDCWINICFGLMLFIFLFTISFFSIYKVLSVEKSYDCNTLYILGSFMGPFICVANLAALASEIVKIIGIYIAPKVFILKHLMEFIK